VISLDLRLVIDEPCKVVAAVVTDDIVDRIFRILRKLSIGN
jgi:hypothetical protein